MLKLVCSKLYQVPTQGKSEHHFLMVFLFCSKIGATPQAVPLFMGGLVFYFKEVHSEKSTKNHRAETAKGTPPYQLGRLLYGGFIGITMLCANAMPAFAAGTTVWQKANEIMKDVYNQILLISTIAAVVTASIALLMMNFSKSGRTVDESRAWLKRIVITWAILNGLGFIMAYITPFFSDGKWNG